MFNFSFTGNPMSFVYLGIGMGVLMLSFGLLQAFLPQDPAAKRIRRLSQTYLNSRQKHNLMKTPDQIPVGLLKALVPEDVSERTQIRLQLEQAGFIGSNSVRNFFVFRLLLAMLIPTVALILVSIRAFIGVPSGVDAFLNGFSYLQVMQILGVCVAIGFYGPTLWLSSRIKGRRRSIENAFPNAMDLLQISSEAGMGFDAAISRVGQQLSVVAPQISQEFLHVQTEILAGRNRQDALNDMADRMGIDEARSFVNVIIQSLQYGSSIADALKSYAAEMRETRELRAQEKANKLPVQMSAVMAMLMLPALFLITLGPTFIRYSEVFSK